MDVVAQLEVVQTGTDTISMKLVNHNTHLTIDAFIQGSSTKKESSFSVGHFGDGLKLSIARLIAMGVGIEFYTGDVFMVPAYKPVRGGTKDAVYLTNYKLQQPTPHLTIMLTNLPVSAFDASRYLFLRPKEIQLYHTPEVGSIIANETNRLYLKGFLRQRNCTDLRCLHVEDYMVKTHDLGRDRNSISKVEMLAIDVLITMIKGFGRKNEGINHLLWSKLANIKHQANNTVAFNDGPLTRSLLGV